MKIKKAILQFNPTNVRVTETEVDGSPVLNIDLVKEIGITQTQHKNLPIELDTLQLVLEIEIILKELGFSTYRQGVDDKGNREILNFEPISIVIEAEKNHN